uniref:Uncharacterized protein n=1 Tax=Leersia perrieri TaxID=77586 RepID=A0A0D9WLS7_9ORYZ
MVRHSAMEPRAAAAKTTRRQREVASWGARMLLRRDGNQWRRGRFAGRVLDLAARCSQAQPWKSRSGVVLELGRKGVDPAEWCW